MRGLSNKRVLRKKRFWGLGALIVTGLVATASLATAQVVPQRDGNPNPENGFNLQTAVCGPSLNSIVRTQNQPSTTSNVPFQVVPGTPTPVNVPDGQSRCIKVLFTAETACGAAAVPDFCYVQALIDGVPMNPNGAGFQAMDSEDPTASAHAYMWVKRVGAGNHVVTIEQRVGDPATVFYLDDWTENVEVYQ